MNLVPQGIVGSVGGGLIWAITDLGPARGHVRIGSHTSKREQCVLKKRREEKKLSRPPPTSVSYLHPPLQVKWNDLMCGPVGVGNGVGG